MAVKPYKVKQNESDLAMLMTPPPGVLRKGLYFVNFEDLESFLRAADAEELTVQEHDHLKIRTVGDLKKYVQSENVAIYVSTETRELHEKLWSDYDEGYEAGRNDADYRPSSGAWIEGYDSGKLMRDRLTHNSYGEYIGEENVSKFKRG